VLLAATNVLDAPILAALTPYPVEPWQGWHRLLVYIEGAMSLASPAIIAGFALTIAVPPERRRLAAGVVAAAWLLASIVLAAIYPSPLVRGAGLQRIYFDADLIGLCVATIAVLTKGQANIAAKRSPDSAFLVALGLVMLTGAILLVPFSPWRLDLFGTPYGGVQLFITLAFATMTAAQVITWTLSSRG
jgi:hypothetical protein